MKKATTFCGCSVLVFLLAACLAPLDILATELPKLGISVIPSPQEFVLKGEDFLFSTKMIIVIGENASLEDVFTAKDLVHVLKQDFDMDASISTVDAKGSIILSRKGADKRVGAEGYQLFASAGQILIKAITSAGIFYGTQTLLQLIQKQNGGYKVAGMEITDWPSIMERAVHYDTKHHQDKMEYVEDFIRDLAHYKINMLVWEWEDKLAYTTHPEIGAPGAFTIEEMEQLTRYAHQYHIQIVPLVQGLGHVSFILKWPQHARLREIPSSNWEFCPLKDSTYRLLFDLWGEAIAATPTSTYIHIGSDETYELGSCQLCKSKAAEIGKSGLYLLFVNKAAQHLKSLGRQVMVWERPMGWEMSNSPSIGILPQKGLVLTESYSYEKPDFTFAKKAKSLGFKVYDYDPNPGIEHLFLPYYYKEKGDTKAPGCLQESHEFLTTIPPTGLFDGIITTSWDDSGLHNQVWMLRFALAAAFSWNGQAPTLDEFRDSFFKDYYGANATKMSELFQLMNEGSYYYMSTFERKVWHWGEIGKTHLPDLPRGDALEYDPFWNKEYSAMVKQSVEMQEKMQQVMRTIEGNLKAGVKHAYDFEVFRSIAQLILHTAQTYKDLSELENSIKQAHNLHYEDHALAYQHLEKAQALIKGNMEQRKTVYEELVTTWEKVRLPKGMSTPEKEYFFQQDRARHFANRAPDMNYLLIDEQKLDLEGYSEKLADYMEYYKKTYLQ